MLPARSSPAVAHRKVDAFAYCRDVRVRDVGAGLQPPYSDANLTPSLQAAVARMPYFHRFGRAGGTLFERGITWRCRAGAVFACFLGASGSACGRTMPDRQFIPTVRAFCAQNPNSEVPMSVQSASAASWRCVAGVPQVEIRPPVDERGYFVESWRRVPYRRADAEASQLGAAKPSRPVPLLRADGIGIARIGMTAAQLRSAGIAVHGGGITGGAAMLAGKGCEYASVPAWPLTAVMFADGRVVRIDVRGRAIRTDRGVRIGDPATKVLRLYPGARSARDTYLPHGQDIEYTPPPPLHHDRLVFIVDFGKVVAMRSGRMPQVEYVEGCL
jgi:hypothetical protein